MFQSMKFTGTYLHSLIASETYELETYFKQLFKYILRREKMAELLHDLYK